MKNYSDLSDVEKEWIRQYKEWTKCGILALAIEKAMFYRKLLEARNINVNDYIK
jgi:hypothetical protein